MPKAKGTFVLPLCGKRLSKEGVDLLTKKLKKVEHVKGVAIAKGKIIIKVDLGDFTLGGPVFFGFHGGPNNMYAALSGIEKIISKYFSSRPSNLRIIQKKEREKYEKHHKKFAGSWDTLIPVIIEYSKNNDVLDITLPLSEYERLESGGLVELKKALPIEAAKNLILIEISGAYKEPTLTLCRMVGVCCSASDM